MKRESVLEAQTGNNDYGAGIAFDLRDVKDDKQAVSQERKKHQISTSGAIKIQTTKRG